MGREGIIYNFYTEWKDMCNWCLGNGVRIGCFPVTIDDKIQAFFFCEVKNGTPSEQEVLEMLKKAVPNVHLTKEIPVAIDWGRIIDEVRVI